MRLPALLSELKRRQIYRGGVMYVVAGWVIVQVATTVFPYFSIPDWAIRLLVVVILLGFPIALVGLWMFESQTDPELRLQDRRRGGDSRDAVVQMLEAERNARERENQALIAALAELREGRGPDATGTATQPAQAAVAVAAAPAPAQPVQASPPVLAPAFPPSPPSPPAAPPRRGASMLFLTLVAACLLASVAWQLLAPASAPQPLAVSGEIAHDVVVPGFRAAERFAVRLIAPVLHRLGLGIAPEHVFIALLALIGLLVLRDFYRQLAELLGRRRARAP